MTPPEQRDGATITIIDHGPEPEWHKDRSLFSPWWGRYEARYQPIGTEWSVQAKGQDHSDALRRLAAELQSTGSGRA